MRETYKLLEKTKLHKIQLDNLRHSLIDRQLNIWGEIWSIKKVKDKVKYFYYRAYALIDGEKHYVRLGQEPENCISKIQDHIWLNTLNKILHKHSTVAKEMIRKSGQRGLVAALHSNQDISLIKPEQIDSNHFKIASIDDDRQAICHNVNEYVENKNEVIRFLNKYYSHL